MTTDEIKTSCTTCIHFVKASDEKAQQKAYGGTVDFDSCARTRRFLSPTEVTTISQEAREEFLEETAEACATYAPITAPEVHRVPVTRARRAPLDFGIQAGANLEEMVSKATSQATSQGSYPYVTKSPDSPSCHTCVFRMDPEDAQHNLGVTGAVCLARGGVLPDSEGANRATASDCDMNTDASPALALRDMRRHMEPQLLGEFMVPPTQSRFMAVSDQVGFVIRERVEANRPFEFVEPSTYETDAEVTEEDKADGIRAWRKLYSGSDSARSVLIPVFDPAHFSKDELIKVPKSGDKEHPELYQDHANNAYKVAALWFKMDETPLLQGVPGTGKTEFFRYIAWLMQVPFERISITGSSELDDLAGKMVFENNETRFQQGRIPKAWEKPCVMCIDEPNVGPLEVWQFIRPLTDNSKQLVLDMADGETVSRHKYCRLGMAINPSWDSRNIGAQPLADADSNRLSHIYVDFPNETIERNILTNRCKADGYSLEDKTIDQIMKIATQLRDMSKSEDLPVTWGIRQQIKVARATEHFDLEDCYRMAVTDNLEPEIGETILNVVKMVERGNMYSPGGWTGYPGNTTSKQNW